MIAVHLDWDEEMRQITLKGQCITSPKSLNLNPKTSKIVFLESKIHLKFRLTDNYFYHARPTLIRLRILMQINGKATRVTSWYKHPIEVIARIIK